MENQEIEKNEFEEFCENMQEVETEQQLTPAQLKNIEESYGRIAKIKKAFFGKNGKGIRDKITLQQNITNAVERDSKDQTKAAERNLEEDHEK